MDACKCRQPVPMQSQVSMYICAACSEKIVGPDPRDAEIAALKAEVEDLREQVTGAMMSAKIDHEMHAQHDADLAAHKRALAAGPAALRALAADNLTDYAASLYLQAAADVEAAQAAAMKEGT